ncbi:MAG: fimbrillin family protein [Rikenellaceae bacterium]|jgi:hypothetical protein|nr:fimbrillin family protein [Rikenellaceae bacterium]
MNPKILPAAFALTAFVAVSCSTGDGGAGEGSVRTAPEMYPITVVAGDQSGVDGEQSRASWDGGAAYLWAVGDQSGLTIAPTGSTSHVAHNVCMSGDHTEPSVGATFTGELNASQIDAMSAADKYDYYSYFPHSATAHSAVAFPNVQFVIPSSISVTKNVLNSDYAPMVATPVKNVGPITWRDGEVQMFGPTVHFNYRHVMSYMAIRMRINLMSAPVTKIVITNTTGGTVSGPLNVNLDNGSAAWAGGSSSLTVNIPGGFNVGDVIYVPMLPGDMGSQRFRFDFYINGSIPNTISTVDNIPGGVFERGKVHNLRLKVPFHVNFGALGKSNQRDPGNFSYGGYGFWGNESIFLRSDNVKFTRGFLSGRGKAVLRLPAFNLTNSDGRTDIPVSLSVYGTGGMDIADSDRHLCYQAISSSSTSVSTSSYMVLDYGNDNYSVKSGSLSLTPTSPCVGFLMDQYTSCAMEPALKDIWVVPNY